MSDDPTRFDPSPEDSDDLYWSDAGDETSGDQFAYGDGDYYDSSDTYLTDDDDSGSGGEPGGSPWGRWIMILVVIVIVILVVALLLRACGSNGAAPGAEGTPAAEGTSQLPLPTFTPTVALEGSPAAPGDAATTEPGASPGAPSGGKFQPGQRVQVGNTEGGGMRFRTGPGATYVTIAILDDGTVLKVVGGPESADGFVWWRLQSADGTIGWGAEDFLVPASG